MYSLPVTPFELAIALTLVTIGSTVQGSVGFGLAVVSAPVLLLLNPIFVPGPLLLAAAVLTILITLRERRSVIRGDIAIGTVGRILGTVPAAYAMMILSQQTYDLMFAGLVMLAVVLSICGWHWRPTPRNVVVAATLSGFAGTVSAVGGPPMALVYQREDGPIARGTMSAIFILGTFISIFGLWWAGHFKWDHFLIGVALMPAMFVGFLLSRYTNRWVDGRATRPAILAVSALSAIVILARALWQ